MWHRIGRVLLVLLAAIIVPVAAAAVAIPTATRQVYPAPGPRSLNPNQRPAPPSIDPDKPTVAIVLGAEGANAADTLAPYEAFALTRAFNVLTVAPTPSPVPLTGGLDIVPDLTFEDLARRLPHPPEVIVVPQINGSTKAVVDWVTRQHQDGAPLIMSVCVGAGILADAGLLTHRKATSHWLGMIGLRRSHPEVDWVQGQLFVDTGDIITTAGVLRGIDGSLRVIERTLGADAAVSVARQLHWSGYQPGHTTVIPAYGLARADLVALLSASYRWDRPTTGVLLTDGVGEIELASAFRPYTELSYLGTMHAVTRDGGPIRSRHGLTFIPRSDWASAAPQVDRLIVPGAQAAATKAASGLPGAGTAVYLHQDNVFPFDGVLQDIARTYDTATATWVAKTLQYPIPALPQSATRWPWGLTIRLVLLAGAGSVLAGILLLLRRRRTRRAPAIGLAAPNSAAKTA
ncbi:DJ-1/PfpI family protein [Actinopolymorpha alba]|uniref:DJ-1/PfpI family protein n=1 Tax=Actinopolymorpha alba TaxID=533267 RepID=UPI00035EF419|nr:DJ-1/PfpI family protein [Actinopolymorpha alba]